MSVSEPLFIYPIPKTEEVPASLDLGAVGAPFIVDTADELLTLKALRERCLLEVEPLLVN